ncbi:unnamed protein product [Closterium sp. NIES-65]|nr:unnamed protein product [Closterium sp. NIES-65]
MAEGIHTLLVDSGLPALLWGEALMWVVWVKNRVTHSALPASITPMEVWSGQKLHVGMARICCCMRSVMLHGHEKGGKLDARAVMCVCVGVDMESKGWRMLDPSLMRIRIARDVDFLENVMWKNWDKAKGFGELLQDAAAISQLLPLPLSPPSATADDVEMPPSSLPPAPLIVSVQQQLSGPSVIQQRSATQATSPSSSSGQRSVPLSTGAPTSPATTSPPPVTGLQVPGIQSSTRGEEVGGDAGVVEGMLCLAREVEGVALAGQGGACSEVPDEGSRPSTAPRGPLRGPVAALLGPSRPLRGPVAAPIGPFANLSCPSRPLGGPVAAPIGPVAAPCGPVAAPIGPVAAPCGPVAAPFGPAPTLSRPRPGPAPTLALP